MPASSSHSAGAFLPAGAQATVPWCQNTLSAWVSPLGQDPNNSQFLEAVTRLCSVPHVHGAVLDLSDLGLPSFPAINQVAMVLTEKMEGLLAHWQPPEDNLNKPAPWSNLPGVKVVYPYLMTGLNSAYIQDLRSIETEPDLNVKEVWVIQRFLQRLYAKVERNIEGKLDALKMDEFFSVQAIYEGSQAQQGQTGSDDLLLSDHFLSGATPLQIVQALNETVRDDVYKRGFGSYNKAKWSNAENSQFYSKRSQIARAKLTNSTSEQNIDENELEVSFEELLRTPAHNCNELVLIAGYVLEYLGLRVFSCAIKGFDHQVLLYGLSPALDGDAVNQIFENSEEIEIEWHGENIAGLFVCDAWANIACSAEHYASQLKEKLQKWQVEGKAILVSRPSLLTGAYEDAWIGPATPERIDFLNRPFVCKIAAIS